LQGKRQSSFCAFFVPLKLEAQFFQFAAVRLNLVLKFSRLNAWQERRQEHHRMHAAKLFLCFFCAFKAGSEILPVRSGAAELGTKDSLG
jgi:hypothetical protein